MEINIHEAKTHFSKLIGRVAAGEEIVITRAGKPVARLVPPENVKERRPLGLDEGRCKVSDDFDAPLQSEVMKRFER